MHSETLTTAGGVMVQRTRELLPYPDAANAALETVVEQVDSHCGLVMSSSVDFPGRYTRWDVGFVNPPLRISSRNREMTVEALNDRGKLLLGLLLPILKSSAAVARLFSADHAVRLTVRPALPVMFEEDRSRRYSVFSVLRDIIGLFRTTEDEHLGLYGVFGYDLAFQFEPIRQSQTRPDASRDMVLYLPDEVVVVDHRKETAYRYCYGFSHKGKSTLDLPGGGERKAFRSTGRPPARACDHGPGEYAGTVRKALTAFRRGDMFEAVPGQVFFEKCQDRPSAIFRRLRQSNPAPYGALFNLGDDEYLVSASPEMFVRVQGQRVETCPISGTIARGANAMEDAGQILRLLNSSKDLAELSMCTDVDRNDKARVCEADSIRVIGRRQVELYSRLIHTVDHVEGMLKPGFDALDAFLSHAWAVTVTGAPKQAAMQFIEDHEKSPRAWYGGAMGFLGFNGNMNTGLTLRCARIQDGIAEVRVGATLLYDSDPEAEAAETELKASALLAAIRHEPSPAPTVIRRSRQRKASAVQVLMVDHQDSFVHMLAGYFEAAGSEVKTVRFDRAPAAIEAVRPDLVVLSPGPGRPADFAMADTISLALRHGRTVFGVCLGLQGLVEYFGGTLAQLDYPMHGKTSMIHHRGGQLFTGLPERFEAGRYHSLVAQSVPACLHVRARADDGTVMAVEHAELPVLATQFHPESILSMKHDAGARLIANVLDHACRNVSPKAASAPCDESSPSYGR